MASNRSAHPEWMATLREGDVLISARGTYRVVREVTRRADGSLHTVTFTIRHPSWTGRAYTCYHRSDLLTLGFRPAYVRVKLTSEMDARIRRCITNDVAEMPGHYSLTAADVRGIA